MADENEIDVGLGLDATPLEQGLQRTLQTLTQTLETSRQLQQSFLNTANNIKPLVDQVSNLQRQLSGATDGAQQMLLGSMLKSARDNLRDFTADIRAERAKQQAEGVAQGAQRRAMLASPTGIPGDTRTLGEVSDTQRVLQLMLQAFSTTERQAEAQLMQAAAKAAERLVTSTAAALDSSLAAATTRVAARNATYAQPGVSEAMVTRARIGAQRLARDYGAGAPQTLEEVEEARRVREYEQMKERLRTQEQRGIQQAAAKAERDAEREAANERTRQERAAWRNMRADADAEDRRRAQLADPSYIARLAAQDTRFENRYGTTRDEVAEALRAGNGTLSERKALLRGLAEAEKNRVEAAKAAAAEQRRLDREATTERNRQDRAAWRNLRGDADAENRQRSQLADPSYIARLAGQDARFEARYGRTRDEVAEALRLGNGTIIERKTLLRDLEAAEKKRIETAKAAAAEQRRIDAEANKKAPRTLEQRVDEATAFRNAVFGRNGGADMFTFQAKLAANYAIFGTVTSAIRGAAGAIVEFDDVLKQFQAITGTANSEMEGFRAQLLAVSVDSKFSVNELAKVAIQLGQTGLSAGEVTKALKPVADLAAASGSTLQQSVEAITGVLGAFNMQADRAGDVADVFVAALNRTRLSMDQLQLGIQYAGNIARDSGVSFSELTASIGAIAQAGVKSGSTIGTGMRQLITELSSPTDKLRGVLKELGISLADVDLHTNGFTSVLETLREKGFGTSEALRALDLRAAAAFSALSGQASKIKLLEQEFLLTSAAAEGAEKANESFTASAQRLGNQAFALVDKGFAPLISVLTTSTQGVTALLSAFEALGPVIPAIGSALAALATSTALARLLPLLGGLLGGGALLTAPVAIGATAIGAVGGILYYLTTLQDEAGKAKARLDELKGVENQLTSRQSQLTTAASDVDTRIQQLIDRRDKLNADPILRRNAIIEAQKAFGDLGLSVDAGANSIDALIEAFQRLRGEMAKEMPTILQQQLQTVKEQMEQLRKLEEERQKSTGVQVTRAVGVIDPEAGPGGRIIRTNDPTNRFRQLGEEFGVAMDYVQGKRTFSETNAKGDVNDVRLPMLREQLAMQQAELSLSQEANSPDRELRLKAVRDRINLIVEAIKAFDAAGNAAVNMQGQRVKLGNVETELSIAEIRKRPEFRLAEGLATDLYGQRERAQQAAFGQKGLPGLERRENMLAALRSTSPDAQTGLDSIEAISKQLIAEGMKPEVVKEAFAPLVERYNALLKSVSKKSRELLDSIKPDVTLDLQQQRRITEAQLATVMKQAKDEKDPAKLQEMQKLAVSYAEKIGQLNEEMFKLDYVNPNELANNPDLQNRREEAKKEVKAKIDALDETFSGIFKRRAEALLTFRQENDQARRDLINKQIESLDKVLKDANTTPEKMREVIVQINRLLEEAAAIAKQQETAKVQRQSLDLPTQVPPQMTAAPGSVQAQIVDLLTQRGKADLIDYAIGSAQRESDFNLNARNKSGATGLFQFMPKTWKGLTGQDSVSTDIVAQIDAFVKLTEQQRSAFKQAFGYDPSPAELYLLHQQGQAGGIALKRNPNANVIDALAPAYGGDRSIAAKAVTGNAGNVDMTAGEFAASIERMYRTSAIRAGRYTAQSGADALKDREQAAKDAVDENTAKEKEKRQQELRAAERERELAKLRTLDRGLTADYEGQVSLVRRAATPEAASAANLAALNKLGELYQSALKQDENRPGRRTDDEKATSREDIQKRFREMAQTEAISAADTVGKATLKVYDDQIKTLKAQLEDYSRPENENKVSAETVNLLKQQINELERKRELEGQSKAYLEEISVLQQSLEAMTKAGLGTSEQALRIQEQLTALKEKQAKLQPAVDLKARNDTAGPTLGNALSGGVDDFLKQRGILRADGGLVSETVEARRLLTAELNTIAGAFENLFTGLLDGSMKAGDAIKKFATTILGGLMQQLSKSLTNDIFRSLFKGGEGGDGLFGGLLGGLSKALGLSGGGGATEVVMEDGALLLANGGPIRMANGGGIRGGMVRAANGTPVTRDAVDVKAMDGEYILRKSAVDAVGRETLDQVNALGGAMVARAPKVEPVKFGGNSAEANVYVVAPEAVPQPGPNDFVAAIGDNIQRGGAIKTLIKRVAAGHQ